MISLDRSPEDDNVSKIMETNTGGLGRVERGRGVRGLINSTGARIAQIGSVREKNVQHSSINGEIQHWGNEESQLA